ncbi:MAG: Mth938-like domain-containing protein [Methylibium sp.]|uniref:Mth938-like domain-containing protein n=1 Tax=Methylibium sp. TaxID=2067992 RepID=UPI00181B26B2|nr:Mth938-like domain-containing protein [Methylibium sp.]MBA3597883.1 Mth938-like domain-containing protein [Methylibium sp.]
MKLQPDPIANANIITGYTGSTVQVGAQPWSESLLLPWQGDVRPWGAARFAELGPAHFETIAALEPELVLFGSGNRLRFAKPEWLGLLMNQRIGLETMDTAAACRTFNLLAAEGRRVVAALLIEAAR